MVGLDGLGNNLGDSVILNEARRGKKNQCRWSPKYLCEGFYKYTNVSMQIFIALVFWSLGLPWSNVGAALKCMAEEWLIEEVG